MRLVNGYGPTETSVIATTHTVLPDEERPLIGTAIPGTTAHLLSDDLNQVDAQGQIYLGGMGVSPGYWRRPGLTAERFVPDPFAGPAARMYRTGDRGRLRGSDLDYLGRADDQIKIRGLRIEPGEIEAVLCRHPGVNQAAVRKCGSAEDARLVGYITAVPGSRPSLSEVRDLLAEHLPSHLVPGVITLLEAFPLNANGKIDRAALPIPDAVRMADSADLSTPAEFALADAWAKALAVEKVGREDNFFDLGGGSLQAGQIAAAIRHAGFAVTVEQIYQEPTLARLAERAVPIRAVCGERTPAASAGLDADLRQRLLSSLTGDRP